VTFVEQVETVLSQARPDGFYRQTIPGMAASVVDARAHIGQKGPNTYVASSGESSLISKPAQLLARLYADANPEEQRAFSRILLDEQRKIREEYFRTRVARCPKDQAILDVEDVTSMGQSSTVCLSRVHSAGCRQNSTERTSNRERPSGLTPSGRSRAGSSWEMGRQTTRQKTSENASRFIRRSRVTTL